MADYIIPERPAVVTVGQLHARCKLLEADLAAARADRDRCYDALAAMLRRENERMSDADQDSITEQALKALAQSARLA